MEKELTVIIVTFNSKEVIGKCLEGIIAPNLKIVVVDNASSDGTADFIRQKFSQVEVFSSPHNVGFGAGCNIGLRQLDTKYGMLLNPDVITSSGAIEELLAKYKNFEFPLILAPRTRKDKKYDVATEYEEQEWVSGSVMLFSSELIYEVGYFDENIFLFSEEIDLCKRARDKGYKILLCNSVFMDHLVGKSSGFNPKIDHMKYWHMGWSRQYYSDKHDNIVRFFLNVIFQIAKYSLKLLLNMISGNKTKIIKYKGLLTGSVSYLIGLRAFNAEGKPRGL